MDTTCYHHRQKVIHCRWNFNSVRIYLFILLFYPWFFCATFVTAT